MSLQSLAAFHQRQRAVWGEAIRRAIDPDAKNGLPAMWTVEYTKPEPVREGTTGLSMGTLSGRTARDVDR